MGSNALLRKAFPAIESARGKRMVDQLASQFSLDEKEFWDSEFERLVPLALAEAQKKLGSDLGHEPRRTWALKINWIVREALQEGLPEGRQSIPQAVLDRMTFAIFDELFGLGPLQPLLDDPLVSEIMVNGCDQVFIEKKGELILCDGSQRDCEGALISACRFRDEAQLMHVIRRIVDPLGRKILTVMNFMLAQTRHRRRG